MLTYNVLYIHIIDKIEHYTINLNIPKLKIAVNYELEVVSRYITNSLFGNSFV